MLSSGYDFVYYHSPRDTRCTEMGMLVYHETSGKNNPMKIHDIQAIKHKNKLNQKRRRPPAYWLKSCEADRPCCVPRGLGTVM